MLWHDSTSNNNPNTVNYQSNYYSITSNNTPSKCQHHNLSTTLQSTTFIPNISYHHTITPFYNNIYKTILNPFYSYYPPTSTWSNPTSHTDQHIPSHSNKQSFQYYWFSWTSIYPNTLIIQPHSIDPSSTITTNTTHNWYYSPSSIATISHQITLHLSNCYLKPTLCLFLHKSAYLLFSVYQLTLKTRSSTSIVSNLHSSYHYSWSYSNNIRSALKYLYLNNKYYWSTTVPTHNQNT